MNTEFPSSEDFIEDEVRRFYEWIGMDTSVLPSIEIDVVTDTPKGGHFDHRGDRWKTVLFPDSGHLNHRLAEGNMSNLKFRGKEERKYGVHEAAHAYFRENFDLPELEYDPEEVEELMTEEMLEDWIGDLDLETMRQIFQINGDDFRINPEFNRDLLLRQADYVREEYGEEEYENFIEVAGLRGIDESLARIMAEKYVCNDVKQLDSRDVYRELRGTFYSAQVVDVEGVKVRELGEKVENDGFGSVLEMSGEELLESYYEPKEEMTFA